MKRFLLPASGVILILGVSVGSSIRILSVQIAAYLLVAVAVSLLSVFQSRFTVLLFLSVCLFGGSAILAAHRVEHYRFLEERPQLSGIGTIQGESKRGSFENRIVVALSACEVGSCPREYVQIRVNRYEEWPDGTPVRIGPCDLKRPERFDPDFDYPMYLAKDGIGFVAENCPITKLPGSGSWWRNWLHRARSSVMQAIQHRLPEPEAGLARGLLLGGNDELPDEVAQDFRTVGLTHIVAVSGYNIAVLIAAFFLVGIAIGWYRKQAIWIALFGTVGFVLLVGAPASAVRAALMAIFGFGALLVSRPLQSVSALLFAAAIMLLWNPLLLRYDIGFQLSFLATFAILISAAWRKQVRLDIWLVGGIIEVVLITLSVLVFVTPLSVFHFGTLSPYALLANTLVSPLVPIAFLLSFLVVAFGWIPGIGAVCGWVAYGSLHALVGIASFIATFPGANFTYPDARWWMFGLWYVGCLIFFLLKRNE